METSCEFRSCSIGRQYRILNLNLSLDLLTLGQDRQTLYIYLWDHGECSSQETWVAPA